MIILEDEKIPVPDHISNAATVDWAMIEQQLAMIKLQTGLLIAPEGFALRRKRKKAVRLGKQQTDRRQLESARRRIEVELYYGEYCPPRQSDDRELLEYARKEESKYIEIVESHITKKKVTLAFLNDWGRLNYFNGIMTLARNTSDDDYQQKQAGKSNEKVTQKLWIAHMILRAYQEIKNRPKAEKKVVKFIEQLSGEPLIRPDADFPLQWFKELLSDNAFGLKSQYTEKNFTLVAMKRYINTNPDIKIPPTNWSDYKKPSP